MNGGNCQNCANSPWVQRANRYVTTYASNPRYSAHVATVAFLLSNGYCGINNRIGINPIRAHLGSMGMQYSRSGFQNAVLTDLKREDIVATLVYPGGQGGVFIPCTEDEVRQVASQVVRRVVQETTDLQGITQRTSFNNIIDTLRRAAVRASRRI